MIIVIAVYVAVVLGLGLLKGMLYGFVGILKGIGNVNVIWFCNYNRNHARCGRIIGKRIGNWNIIRFGIDNGGICSRNFTLFWKL